MAAGRVLADLQLRAVKDLNHRRNKKKKLTFCRFRAESNLRTGASGRERLVEGCHIYIYS